MIEEVNIRKLDSYEDKRGYLLKILRKIDVGNELFGEIYLVTSKPGVIRANHFHKETKEWFCILKGKGTLKLRSDENEMDIEMDEKDRISVEIPPFVSHAIKNTGEETLYLVAYASKEYDTKNPDTYPADIQF